MTLTVITVPTSLGAPADPKAEDSTPTDGCPLAHKEHSWISCGNLACRDF